MGWPSLDHDQRVSDHQKAAIRIATSASIGILTGGPGSGKTFCASSLISEVIKREGADSICVVGPTGKAAVRITDAMQSAGVNLRATTIHSALGVMSGEGGWSFRRNQSNPFPYRFIVADEGSMICCDLMANFLAARGPGTQILFLADINQLAPVGHGAPIRDLIQAGVPCGQLTEIRRNSGRIVLACADIRDSHRFSPSQNVDVEHGENLMHVESSGPESTIEYLEQFIKSIQAGGKYDPIWDVQVLVAVNKKSPLGRRPLNQMLQGLLNPTGKQAPPNKFRLADKLINLKNGWFQSLDRNHPEANDEGKVFVANGEIGEAILVEPARTICRLQFPERVVVILHSGKSSASEDIDDEDKQGPNRRDQDDDEDTGTGSSWELAYCCSGHKFQGSEVPIAVILLDSHPSAQRVCTRNWLFTGISRAKTLCVTIGPARIAHQMCQKDGLRRRTFLVEQIRELRLPPPPEPMVVSDEMFRGIFAGIEEFAGGSAIGASA